MTSHRHKQYGADATLAEQFPAQRDEGLNCGNVEQRYPNNSKNCPLFSDFNGSPGHVETRLQ